MSDKLLCSARVYSQGGSFNGFQCVYKMKVMHNGQPFCGIHDPAKAKARADAQQAKRHVEEESQRQVRASAQTLIDALGVGTPEYSIWPGKWGSYTGKIVLTADEAQQLIARLETQNQTEDIR